MGNWVVYNTNMLFVAHADHEVLESNPGLLNVLTHQSVWLSLFIIGFFLFGVYALLEKLKVKALNRVIVLVPLLLLIAILYLEHNPAVTTVLLSVGFVATFILAFTMMGANRDSKTKNVKETDKQDEKT